MSDRASMPTFVPRTVASFERAATVVARRVAAPVRMLATRALSFADRLVGTWAGTSPMVGGLEGGARSPMRAATRGGGGSMLLPRPWYEVDADEDAIWPQQAARAATAAAARTAATGAASSAAAPTGATTAPGATPVLPAAERGAAIARTNLTAPPERATRPATPRDEAGAPIAADTAATREATANATTANATTATPTTTPPATAATADLRAAEALGLYVTPVQPMVAAAPVARATTPLARALAHAAWVDQQLRTTAPVAPIARASAGYVFIAPVDAVATTERARAATTTTAAAPTVAAAQPTQRAAAAAAAMSTTAAPVAMAPSVAAWSATLPDPRLASAMPAAIARVADFVAQLVGAQAARDVAPAMPAATTTFAPTVAETTTTTAMPRRVPERTFVVLPPPAVATVSWRPGAAAARVEQLGASVDARVSAAWGEPAPTTATTMATASPRLAPIAAAAPATRAVPAAERIFVAPSDVAARATGPARSSQFMQQLVGVQAARATAPLPVQALVAALARDATTTTSAATASTTTGTAAAASRRAPERVALTATLADQPVAATGAMMPGAMARRAEQLGGVVGVRAASLSIDFVDPARLSMLSGEAPAMTTVAPAAQPASSDTIMPAPRPLFATASSMTVPALTAEEWSLVATFPSTATAVQLAAARQAAPWSATTTRATLAPERTLLAAIAERGAAASPSRAAARGGAPAEYVAPTVAPTETQARLPGGRAPRGSFTWPKVADYTPRAEWTVPAAVTAAEQAKQAAPGAPLWGVMQAPLVTVSPSLAASTGVTATGAASRPATDAMADATPALSREPASPAQPATGREQAPARSDAARGDAPAMTLMTAAATRETRAAARMGTRDVVRADGEPASEPQRTTPSMPITGGGGAVRTGGVSNVRPLPAMPLMAGGPPSRDGAHAAGAVGPGARALELARPFLRLVEGGVAGDGAQRSSAGPRFFEQPQPVVSGSPASDSASRIVEALRSQPAGGGSSDDRVSLADLTLIAIASATQQVAASPAGGGPSGGGGAAAAAPAASASAAPSSSKGASGNPAQEIEELARAAFDELQRLMSIAHERSGGHG